MNLVPRVKNILISPKTEWMVIKTELSTMQQVIMQYVFPLAVIASVATFLGYWLIGMNAMILQMGGIRWGLYYGLTRLIQYVLAVLIASFVVDALAPSFGSERNLNRSAQLVGYAYTPVLVGGILSIVPAIGFLGNLFGLYGIYLWYMGLTPIKNTPEDKKVGYVLVSIIILIVVYIIIGWILGSLFMSVLGLQVLSGFKM